MMRKADLIQIPQIKSDDLERLWKRLPIYGYLQEKSVWEPKKEDPETYEKIVQANEEYLEGKVLDENQELVQQEAQKEQEEKQKEEELQKEKEEKEQEATETAVTPHPVLDLSPERLADYNYLLNNFFIVDPNTATNPEQLNAANFLAEDLTMKQDSNAAPGSRFVAGETGRL